MARAITADAAGAGMLPRSVHTPLLRVAQVGESRAAAQGGLAAAFTQLSNTLSRLGAGVSVVTLDEHRSGAREWPLDPAVETTVCGTAGPRRAGYARDMAGALSAFAPDVVHVHGLWRLHYRQAARYARDRGVPLVISVHGMLHERALKQRPWAKRLARHVFQDAVLRSAACLHATADDEAGEIERLGLSRPIAVVPWGVPLPDDETVRAARAAREHGERTLLFLGRIHASKGLESLLRAWARVSPAAPRWRLRLAGPDEGGYGSLLETLARELGVRERVVFSGPVEGAAREEAFASADVLVLPSPAENFGFVVPEALVRGIPVIATHGSPWPLLTSERCGWWVEADDRALEQSLADAVGSEIGSLRSMGLRGRAMARTRFAWDTAGHSMMSLYEWVLARRPAPPFVTSVPSFTK